jgi:DNA-binding phage protein
VLRRVFRFVKVVPREYRDEWEVASVADGNVLYSLDAVLEPVVGFLVSRGWARSTIKRELEYSVHDIAVPIDYRQIDPWGYLRLRRGVLDLRELKLLDHVPYYFRSRLSVEVSEEELREIREGGYRVEDNEVYKLWRNHFEDEDWEYLVHSLGTWLAPYRFRHIAFLIGPTGIGKTTLVRNLTNPVNPIVAWVSLRSLTNTNYPFSREALIGRQVVVYTERGDVILRNLDAINNIFGEEDYVEVHRKHKPAVWIPCPKAGLFVMNEPLCFLRTCINEQTSQGGSPKGEGGYFLPVPLLGTPLFPVEHQRLSWHHPLGRTPLGAWRCTPWGLYRRQADPGPKAHDLEEV